MLDKNFFNEDPRLVAVNLLGKVINHKFQDIWLCAQIIETEAYLMNERGSHASLGYTEKRKALFMEPGTIYMYYARGGDSLNISCKGSGNAVLIKSGIPFTKYGSGKMISKMKLLNPVNNRERNTMKLCSGQTLLCKSLGLKVINWDKKKFDPNKLFISDEGFHPEKIIQTKRLGIPKGRDEDLMFRYVDFKYAKYCTKNPLTAKGSSVIINNNDY